MAVNKVEINGQTAIDLTRDTVTPGTLQKGYTAHDKSGAKITGTLEPSSSGGGSASETWMLNENCAVDYDGDSVTFNVDFTSQGFAFSSITLSANFRRQMSYDHTVVKSYNKWANVGYRKLIFNASPTGDLLTWLQANGVKQPANLAVQPPKDVTITSNGTIEIPPDVPYNALEQVNVTVNVPSSGVASTTVKITAILLNEDSVDILGISPEGMFDFALDAGKPTAEIEIIQGSPLVLACTGIASDISGTNCSNYYSPVYQTGGAEIFLYAVIFTDENLNPTASGTLKISI